MQKTAFCALIVALLLANCFKKTDDCSSRNIVAPAAEQAMVTDYLTAHSITAAKHESGLYYEVINEGSGAYPAICSSVKVGFVGKLVDGTVAEQDAQMVLNLKLMLEAWRISLPLIKAGGNIRIYVPPTLGYGADGKKVDSTVIVPPHSMLIYDITLYEVL